jgi:hypothetical protein
MIPNVMKGHSAFILGSSILLGLLYPEDEGTVILLSIRNNWPEDVVSYLRRFESIVPLL